jgi:hypothetical protein
MREVGTSKGGDKCTGVASIRPARITSRAIIPLIVEPQAGAFTTRRRRQRNSNIEENKTSKTPRTRS